MRLLRFLQRSFACLFVGFGESAVTVFVSCHVPGDVAPWLRGTRFCAESRDECLLVPACLLGFLFEGCFLVFCGSDNGHFLGLFFCFADWNWTLSVLFLLLCGLRIGHFLGFFFYFADWRCAQAHLGSTYYTDMIHFLEDVSD